MGPEKSLHTRVVVLEISLGLENGLNATRGLGLVSESPTFLLCPVSVSDKGGFISRQVKTTTAVISLY